MALGNRTRVAATLCFGLSAAGLAGCFFPDYTFDGGEAGGGGSGAVTTATGTTSTTTGGGGATTATTGTGGASTTSTTSSTGGGSGGEDCLNGSDDDGDNLVDCEDDDCQAGYKCAEKIPTGWGLYGYVALSQSLPGSEPACPAAYPDLAFDGNETPIAASATCSACSCGAPTGEVCTLPDLDSNQAGIDGVRVSDQQCGLNPFSVGYLKIPSGWNGSCHGAQGYGAGQMICGQNNNSNCNISVNAGAPVVTGGTCAASGGTATVPPLSWAVSLRACAGGSSGGGCGTGSQCLANPTAGFESNVCVAQAGDLACPGSFSQKYIVYDPAEVVDSRDCTSCQCNPSSGATCKGQLQIFSDPTQNTCTMSVATFSTGPTTGGCANLIQNPAVFSKQFTVNVPPNGGTCAVTAGGGASTGSVTLGQPTTVCCVP